MAFRFIQYYQDFSGANKGGTLGLDTSRNVSGISNSLLQQCCDDLFAFFAIKEGLAYHLCLVRNMWTKYFNFFQGLRAQKCHQTKRSNCMNYRSKWYDPCRRLFQVQPLFPPGFPEFLTPLLHEFPESHLSGWGGGVDFFWNNPIKWVINKQKMGTVAKMLCFTAEVASIRVKRNIIVTDINLITLVSDLCCDYYIYYVFAQTD